MNNRHLSIVVGIVLGIVFAIGGAFLLAIGIKNAKAVVKYDQITVDEETVNYLVAYYKANYISDLQKEGVDASDTNDFWLSSYEYGITYGEHFNASVRSYIAMMVVKANHYANHSTYTADDKIALTALCDGVLTAEADGDVSIFNAEAKRYGFNYNDFQNAAALIYKAKRADECYLHNSDANMELLIEDVIFKGTYNDINTLAIPALEKFLVYR